MVHLYVNIVPIIIPNAIVDNPITNPTLTPLVDGALALGLFDGVPVGVLGLTDGAPVALTVVGLVGGVVPVGSTQYAVSTSHTNVPLHPTSDEHLPSFTRQGQSSTQLVL